MSELDLQEHFEELDAGRVLGDLDAAEIQEWKDLKEKYGFQSDLSLELVAAAVETEFIQQKDEEMPAHLLENLRKEVVGVSSDEPVSETIVRPSLWKKVSSSPQLAWGIAALFAILLMAQSFFKDPKSSEEQVAKTVSAEEARDVFLGKAGDVMESNFGGTEDYAAMSGKVVWSDSLQEGYMTLTDLPKNDPSLKQYQLWIVDPTRDEKPVDGGVFDVPVENGTVVIPIRNPLVITDPKAFVVTLEQPGGVVVSKQEVVVALAKPS